MLNKIEDLNKRLQDSKITNGCVRYYPDDLKEEALALHIESKMKANLFSKLIGIAPKTIREWRNFFSNDKIITNEERTIHIRKVKINKNSHLTLSDGETKESILAKKKIRNKARYTKFANDREKLEKNSIDKKEINKKPKEELPEDIKTYLARSIDAAIPIVNTRGDVIPQRFRDMQSQWLETNKVKKYSGGGNLLN